jgi:CRISPR-associated endonuclease/helicase Cas3
MGSVKTSRQFDSNEFRVRFQFLTEYAPMRWQERLYESHFVKNDVPGVIDIPTGLGKTSVMAIWLIARETNVNLPRRLIYVVDRRTVVDQATALAMKLQERTSKDKLSISTLRGQLADNREWSRDPTRMAIIIGTVDLIGSALLFSGYRSSYKRRPLEAGLLGQDSLLVLDEAHLSKPFEKLLGSIEAFQRSRGADAPTAKPMCVVRMSATSPANSITKAFRLEGDFESSTGDFADGTVRDRYNAAKRLIISQSGEKAKLTDELIKKAIALAEDSSVKGKRIVVFVRRPGDAKAVAKGICEHTITIADDADPMPKKIKLNPYAKSVDILTGTMRGLERDELVEKSVFKERWLNGDLKPDDHANQSPVFLVSTSAGEVGFDLNADHMVSDATTIDSFIQRLGRVNRRGLGDARVCLIVEPTKKEKDGTPKKLEGHELAIANTTKLLQGVTDVSPRDIATLKSGEWKGKYTAACSPELETVDLTDILLDAWSMTSITERMPGRPDVGPWLRGLEDEQAQTSIAWRAELELFRNGPPPERALQAIFAKHPIRPHETLTVNTGYFLEFLKRIPKLKDRRSDLMATRAAVLMPRGQVIYRTLQQLADEPRVLYADSTLILPARFGGLDVSGMLDEGSIPEARNEGDPEPESLDVADYVGYEQAEDARSRLRILIKRAEDGSWTPGPLPGDAPFPDEFGLKSEYDKTTQLFQELKAADLRVRLVQPVRVDEERGAVESLVMLSPAIKRGKPEEQSLADHVRDVEEQARRIANLLGLVEDNPTRIALLFAAKWHDEGKKAPIWQRFANNPNADGVPLGKTVQFRDPKSLRGYRHEFGSLLRIHQLDRCGTPDCKHPHDPDTRDLALHLITTHHGAGRPHFGHALYDPFSDAERDAIHTDAIRRFARLQRRYGWWRLAWLENLLRCADALASADLEAEDDPIDAGAAEQ